MLAIAAHVYERGGKPTMTDACYDRMSLDAEARGTELVEFNPYTGQWVESMNRGLLDQLYDTAMKQNMGKDDLHGPAIRYALDQHGIEYSCCRACESRNCYEER
jgi:hypothetical protein